MLDPGGGASEMTGMTSPTRRHDGAVRAAVSEEMVALLKENYGVGPTQAKTYYFDDLVVCLLRGGFTRVERTLLEGGRSAAVIQQRMRSRRSCAHVSSPSSRTPPGGASSAS
jgi:hypothetical protein